MDAVAGTKCKREGIRARSRSMVNGVRKLTRLHSFSGSVPRYVGILKVGGGGGGGLGILGSIVTNYTTGDR